MKFNKWIFYGLTVVIAIAGFAISASGDSIFAQPDDFHSTVEQRSQFYPSTWHFGGGFSTDWELIDYDAYYVYFDPSTSHSYTLNFRIEKGPGSTVNVVFTSINKDSRGYGDWAFSISLKNLATGASLGFISSFSGEQTINVQDLEGYKVTLSGSYEYLACVSSIGDTCIVIDDVTKSFTKTATLDLTSRVWEAYQAGYEQLAMSITAAVAFVLFSVEYGINFKDRNKTFRIVNAVTFAGNGGIMIYALIDVFKAISNKSVVGMTSPTTLIIIAIVAHLIVNIVEGRQLKNQRPRPTYAPARPVSRQPSYQRYTPQPPQTYRQHDTSTLDGLIMKLRTGDSWARKEAAESLGNYTDERAINALKGALSDENRAVRLNAENSLRALGALPSTSQPHISTPTTQTQDSTVFTKPDATSQQPLGAKKICPSCGINEEAEAKFCTNCGSKLD